MKQAGSHTIAVGVAGIADPAHDARPDRVEPDSAGRELALHPAHAAAEAVDVLLSQQPVRREDPVTEETDAVAGREDDALIFVNAYPQTLEERADLIADIVQAPLVASETRW
jgi:hypothetical protein